MRILVFDTETTGVIPRGIKNVTMTNLDSLPHIVQISYVICDSDYSGKIVKIANHIIRIPKNIIMDDKNISIHRITNEMSQKNGEFALFLLAFLDTWKLFYSTFQYHKHQSLKK